MLKKVIIKENRKIGNVELEKGDVIYVVMKESFEEIKGVKIGDKFKQGSSIINEVVDFYEVRSLKHNKIVEYQCVATDSKGLSTNLFIVPFATVIRNRI